MVPNMNATDALRFNPKTSLSTFQFENDVLNNLATGLITTVIIANIGSIINRLVALSQKNVFNFSSYTRAFLFANSDDPLLVLSWLLGRYEFRVNDGSHTRLKLENKRLIAPLLARCAVLVISIGSIALAFPSEKVLDACSGGDYAVYVEPLRSAIPDRSSSLFQFCPPLKLESSLGKLASSSSLCSSFLPTADAKTGYDIVQQMESLPGAVVASYHTNSGILTSMLVSSRNVILLGNFVEWRLSNGDILLSTISDYRQDVHLGVVIEGVRHATNLSCEVIQTLPPDFDDGEYSIIAFLDCVFDPEKVMNGVISALRTSIRFRKQDDIAWRIQIPRRTPLGKRRICGTEVIMSIPLVNVVPLLIGAAVSFALNKIIAATLTSRADVTHLGFHIVRELLGHDTTANPLQQDKAHERDERVEMRRYVCADGISAHVGFIEGDGDAEVTQFEQYRRVSRCSQVAGAGRRFVRTCHAAHGGTV